MSKLFRLKRWHTVTETARRLSIALDEEVSDADVLRLALDGQLPLSVILPSLTPVYRGEVAALEYKGVTECDEGWPNGFPIDQNSAIVFDKEVTYLGDGPWLLPFVGGEATIVMNAFRAASGTVCATDTPLDPIFLTNGYGEFFELQVHSDRNESRFGAGVKYQPADFLPDGAFFVVMTSAISRFESELSDGSVEPPVESCRQNVSNRLAKLNQASTKFWANADRDDRSTHPNNQTVAAWLETQGFSPTLAASGASVIRPEWAPIGRKPEE